MEWKRILYNWRSIVWLLCLLLVNGVAYSNYIKNHQDEYMMAEDEYQQYIQEFPERVQTIIENGQRLAGFSVFSGENPFARANIEQTAEDFSRVKGIRPVLLKNQKIASLFSFGLVHFCIFAFGVWLVFLFTEEKKKGLEILIHTYRNGRARMFITRFFILVTGMTVCCFLMYFSMFIIVMTDSGGISLRAPVQSLPMLGEVTIPCSILYFMLIAFLLQAAGSILTVMAVWFILWRVRNLSIGIGISILLLGGEYVLWSSVSVQSNLCLLRYANFFFSLNLSELATQYYNIRLGSMAVPAVRLYVCFLVSSMAVLFFLLFVTAMKRYPVSAKGRIEKWLDAMMAVLRKAMAGFPVFIWELYKMLWCQKGMAIFLLFFCLLLGTLDDSPVLFTAEQEYLNAFYEKNSGPATEDIMKELEKDVMLQEQLEFVKQRKSEGWDGIWLVNQRGYEILAGGEGDHQRNLDSMMAGLCILLILSGALIYERKRDMMPLLRCGRRSLGWLFWQKSIAADLVVLGTTSTMFIIEWKRVSVHYTLDCLHAPVQSLPFLSGISLPVSLGVYISFLAVGELLILYTYKNLVMLLSALCSSGHLVILAGILCLIPNALMGTLIIRGVFTDTAFYIRCGEIFFLLILNVVLFQAGMAEWRKRC